MSKKKTVKKKKEKTVDEILDDVVDETLNEMDFDNLISRFFEGDEKINQRINRIVDAHEKCKSLKGL